MLEAAVVRQITPGQSVEAGAGARAKESPGQDVKRESTTSGAGVREQRVRVER